MENGIDPFEFIQKYGVGAEDATFTLNGGVAGYFLQIYERNEKVSLRIEESVFGPFENYFEALKKLSELHIVQLEKALKNYQHVQDFANGWID